MQIDRRGLILGSAASAICASTLPGCVPIDASTAGRLAAKLRIIEAASGGVLGVSVRHVGTGRTLDYRADQRFAQCSSFKFSLAAMVLKMGQDGQLDLSEKLHWSRSELMATSPFTASRIDQGATVLELAENTQTYSDNTAANVLLARLGRATGLGGPAALTRFWRSLGDDVSRLDRTEPALNNVPPGEIRDTTSPAAMALTTEKILFGDVLSASNSALLQQWMADTRTGVRRVRAGLPADWRAGDKTGTSIWPGTGGIYVDIGFASPAGTSDPRQMLTFATYLRTIRPQAEMDPASEDVLAQVGRVIAQFSNDRRTYQAPV
ncbi:class A beta-lactamase [Altererythrobacter confluentis]|uniref:beta-lactamase n=1 Tax=Allopontixanthobacter confluentis TaxID=1849021 RepID=A0A6L7GJ34_9SPHN|nr:class A beta-lactamase [Allopontixanthobacter confluentis]MXP15595.1 class A beta-lactamase [Allopontixanthobacter confluentis]